MGLLGQQMPAQGQQQIPAQGQEQAQKKEMSAQKAFDNLIVNALNIIHDEQSSQRILQRIQAGGGGRKVLGRQSLEIMQRLSASAEENQITIPMNAGLEALGTIVNEIVDLSNTAGITEHSDEEKQKILAWTLGMYFDHAVQSGKISKNDLVSMADDVVRGQNEQRTTD